MQKQCLMLMGLVVVGLMIVPMSAANAAWIELDNFESRDLGNLEGQGGWVDNLTSTTLWVVQDDPTNPGNNQIARFTQVDKGMAKVPVSIPDQTTSTIFYRMQLASSTSGTWRIGVGEDFTGAASTWAGQFANFEAYVQNTSGASTPNQLQAIRGIPSISLVNLSASISRQTWYNFWQVLDNDNKTYDVFIQGGTFALPTQIGTAIPFRGEGGIGNLTTFYILDNSGSSVAANQLYFDDLYQASGVNLTNPTIVPEPNAFLLSSFWFTGLMYCRRKYSRSVAMTIKVRG